MAWIYLRRGDPRINTIFHYGNTNYNEAFGLIVYDNCEFGADEWDIHTSYGCVRFDTYEFLVITLSNGNVKKYYKNGKLLAINEDDPDPKTNLTNIPVIGARISIDRFFTGYIDEVRIYNRALSDSEIKAIYEATK